MHVTWEQTLAVWWSAAWRGSLYGAIGGIVLGVVFDFLADVGGASERASLYGAIGGYIGTVPGSILALKQALDMHLKSLTHAGG